MNPPTFGRTSKQSSATRCNFKELYVFLTVHLGIILVNDQLDAGFVFFICLFQSSTCFEQPRAYRQGTSRPAY
jgi:hypothetical protein